MVFHPGWPSAAHEEQRATGANSYYIVASGAGFKVERDDERCKADEVIVSGTAGAVVFQCGHKVTVRLPNRGTFIVYVGHDVTERAYAKILAPDQSITGPATTTPLWPRDHR